MPSAFRRAKLVWGDSRMCVYCIPNGFAGGGLNSIVRGQLQPFPKWNGNKANKKPWPPKRAFPRRRLIATRTDSEILVTNSKHTDIPLSNRDSKRSPHLTKAKEPARRRRYKDQEGKRPGFFLASLPPCIGYPARSHFKPLTSNLCPLIYSPVFWSRIEPWA